MSEQSSPNSKNLLLEPTALATNSIGKIGRFVQRLRSSQMQSIAGTVGTQLAVFGLQAIHSIILARLLSPHDRGEYGTVVFFTQTLLYAGMLGTTYSIARRAHASAGQSDSNGLNGLARASFLSGLATGVLSLAIVTILAWIALPGSKAYLAPLCIFAGLLLPVEHARLALLSIDHGSGEYRRYNINRLISAGVFPVLLVLGWSLDIVSVTFAASMGILSAVVGLVSLAIARRKLDFSAAADPNVGSLLKEGRSYAAAYFASQILGRLDVLLIIWFLDLSTQGHYAVAVAASSFLQVVPNALSLYSFNMGVKHNTMSRGSMVRYGVVVFAIQFLSAIALAGLLYYFLPLLFGAKYSMSIPMAIALLPGLAVEGVASVAEGFLRGRGRPLSTLFPRTLGALVLFLSAYLLYPHFSSMCIPIATSIGHTVCGLAILVSVLASSNQQSTSSEASS